AGLVINAKPRPKKWNMSHSETSPRTTSPGILAGIGAPVEAPVDVVALFGGSEELIASIQKGAHGARATRNEDRHIKTRNSTWAATASAGRTAVTLRIAVS